MCRSALRLLLAVLLLASAPWCVASDAAQPKGALVIIGGNLRPGNAPVWERIIKLAGGRGARIAVFASASGTPERSGKFLVERLNSYGAKAFFVPVAVKLSGSNYQAVLTYTASTPYAVWREILRRIRHAGIGKRLDSRALDAEAFLIVSTADARHAVTVHAIDRGLIRQIDPGHALIDSQRLVAGCLPINLIARSFVDRVPGQLDLACGQRLRNHVHRHARGWQIALIDLEAIVREDFARRVVEIVCGAVDELEIFHFGLARIRGKLETRAIGQRSCLDDTADLHRRTSSLG